MSKWENLIVWNAGNRVKNRRRTNISGKKWIEIYQATMEFWEIWKVPEHYLNVDNQLKQRKQWELYEIQLEKFCCGNQIITFFEPLSATVISYFI